MPSTPSTHGPTALGSFLQLRSSAPHPMLPLLRRFAPHASSTLRRRAAPASAPAASSFPASASSPWPSSPSSTRGLHVATLVATDGENYVRSPSVIVDKDRLRRNITKVQEYGLDNGARIRPSLDCHRTWAIAALQLVAGARGVCCAKADHARSYIERGARDILVTHPVPRVETAMSLLTHGADHSLVDPSFRDVTIRFVAETRLHVDILEEAVKGCFGTRGSDPVSVSVVVDGAGAGCGIPPDNLVRRTMRKRRKANALAERSAFRRRRERYCERERERYCKRERDTATDILRERERKRERERERVMEGESDMASFTFNQSTHSYRGIHTSMMAHDGIDCGLTHCYPCSSPPPLRSPCSASPSPLSLRSSLAHPSPIPSPSIPFPPQSLSSTPPRPLPFLPRTVS